MFNYNRIIFKDNETPLNAITMNHLEIAIHKLANHSLFPSDLIGGEGIDISSTEEGKVRIEQKNKGVFSLNINRLDVVYELPEDATMGELYLLLSEDNVFQGLYWGKICLFKKSENGSQLEISDGELMTSENENLKNDKEDNGTI